MRVLERFWGKSASAALFDRRWPLGLRSDTFKNIGYVRDALLILGIVALGTYFLENPETFDAVLNWTLGRHTGGPVI